METKVFLDTHVVVWLYTGQLQFLSKKAKSAINSLEIQVSPIVLLEVDYLHEIKKIKIGGWPLFNDLAARIDLKMARDSFVDVVQQASRINWTRDVFDRLIVAQAKLHGAPLVTKDRQIRKHTASIW